MKLLAIIEARTITGPAKNLLEFARLARAHGIDTEIATFIRGEETNLFVETALRDGTRIHTMPEAGRFDRAAIRGLQALADRVRPDIVQTHAVKSHFLARLAGWPRRAAWIAFHHGYTWPDVKVRLYNQLDRWSLRSAAKVLTVSRPFQQQLEAQGVRPDRIHIVHNAIRADWAKEAHEPERAAALRAQWNIPQDRPVILIVGRLSREKDHLTLIEAVARLRTRFSPYLVVVGDGPEQGRMEERIAALGMTDCVTLTGHQKSAEPFYGIASVAVLASWSEGSPNAMLEAMAAGIPVVSTAVGGVPEIVVNGESALLVQPGQPEPMAAAMEQLLADPALGSRLAGRARRLILERYTSEQRTSRLAEIYRSVRAR